MPADPVLSTALIEKATAWALLHRRHVESLASLAANSYPPTLGEDKRNPELWKAGHWKWFISEHPLPENRD